LQTPSQKRGDNLPHRPARLTSIPADLLKRAVRLISKQPETATVTYQKTEALRAFLWAISVGRKHPHSVLLEVPDTLGDERAASLPGLGRVGCVEVSW
jgi:hypothetical protein